MDIIQTIIDRVTLASGTTSQSNAERVRAQKSLPLSPWDLWTLFYLVRHRKRQEFVAETIRHRLGGKLEMLSGLGAAGHPERPQSGVVPGLPEWEYYFHGIGCCLTHRMTGEGIDVDFFDATAEWFDLFFCVAHLRSLAKPTFVEKRLIELHPSFSTIRLSIDQLVSLGLLQRHPKGRATRLAFPHEELLKALKLLEPQWENLDTQKRAACLFGDDLFIATFPEERSRRQRTAKQTLQSRRDFLGQLLNDEEIASDALRALYELPADDLDDVLRQTLRARNDRQVLEALKIIQELNDPVWCDEVEGLLRWISPNAGIPNTWLKCAEILLAHGRKPKQLHEQFLQIKSYHLGDAAILALEHFPELAIALFRKSLRSNIPLNRSTAAAALAILDQLWSRELLLDVVRNSEDQEATSECRVALLETHDSDCHSVVLKWEERNPPNPTGEEHQTMGEMYVQQQDTWMRWEIQKLHERVFPLRHAEVL